ncbi:MAG: proline dehydrogenase family protein [Collimonas sp.]|uniref:proline dehydrogenase family protein n=1 Tax=Collimonas sp. TaxID=1963772 RepID=UPI0032634B64
MVTPTSSFGAQTTSQALPLLAADALRKIARDEKLKASVENDPLLSVIFKRAAERYIGGSTLPECIRTIRQINAQGHAASADYMGESTRDEAKAAIETAHFLELVAAIKAHALNCTISLDLSHIGLAVDPALGIANAARIAIAARAIGREVIISMEGSERTDAILAAHAELCRQFDHVGITLQARRLRTGADLQNALQQPGKIRLVKGAYDEPETLAHPRGSEGLSVAYRQHAETLLASGHACSIGTQDRQQLEWAHAFIRQQGLATDHIEFETLLGLGAAPAAQMRDLGYATRQYIVYGREWFMYVCHRIAEDPQRLFQALIDVVHGPDQP